MPDYNLIARTVVQDLGIADSIQNCVIEPVSSPFDEKALIKRKKGQIDVKLTFWNDDTFALGRMYHLFLYICDVLDGNFRYNPALAPDEEKEPDARNMYNQIWSIYVDSRIDRRGIENFYDRLLRRNIFIDTARNLAWDEATEIFQGLWDKETFSYPEIIENAYGLSRMMNEKTSLHREAFRRYLCGAYQSPSAKSILNAIGSEPLRTVATDLLSFTTYECKDTFVLPTYYGILFIFDRKVLAEIIPTEKDEVFFTIFDVTSHRFHTHIVTEGSDLAALQADIREKYRNAAVEASG